MGYSRVRADVGTRALCGWLMAQVSQTTGRHEAARRSLWSCSPLLACSPGWPPSCTSTSSCWSRCVGRNPRPGECSVRRRKRPRTRPRLQPGLLNLFLALGTAAGIVPMPGREDVGVGLLVFGLGAMVAAATVLITADRSTARAALVQGLFPGLGLLCLLVGPSRDRWSPVGSSPWTRHCKTHPRVVGCARSIGAAALSLLAPLLFLTAFDTSAAVSLAVVTLVLAALVAR